MIQTQILVIGGGIAGLWLLHVLRAAGYAVLLLEQTSCGAGQTVAAQGMLHDGRKYRLTQPPAAFAESLQRWTAALDGAGPVPLDRSVITSPSQQFWLAHGLASLVRQTLGAFDDALPRARWPEFLDRSGFRGSVRASDFPVLDTRAVLTKLVQVAGDRARVATGDWRFERKDAATLDTLTLPGGHRVSARCFVFAAGGGNAILAADLGLALPTQRRPLRQVLGRGAPASLFGHYFGRTLDAAPRPSFTITTHRADNGELVWYLGGQVAEPEAGGDRGVELAQRHLAALLPRADLSALRWSTFAVDRAESKRSNGAVPDEPVIERRGNALFAWPQKLTLAPLLAERMLAVVRECVGQPEDVPLAPEWVALTAPTVAVAPWQ